MAIRNNDTTDDKTNLNKCRPDNDAPRKLTQKEMDALRKEMKQANCGKKEKALRLMTEVDLYLEQRQAKESQPDKT